ncbi:hypothetical protein [Ktedonospora formicarum]|uniref:hypothetical protein n=1 Tax=Ktedonospora formicarum TaxID=2778364 RepID=UPI001C6889FB|nr:hypothetical protein [Ktedonospora formicarum]
MATHLAVVAPSTHRNHDALDLGDHGLAPPSLAINAVLTTTSQNTLTVSIR